MKKQLYILLIIFLLVIGVFLSCDVQDITLETILSWQPPNPVLAAALILLMYAVKSITVFFPIMVLQIITGHFFSRDIAIFLNTLGLVIVMSVPYWIGRYGGASRIEKLTAKYPKVSQMIRVQQDNEMALCFMLRACAVPPADIVTIYLGASGIHFNTNVIGGVLGCFPSMVLTTFLGANIRNPESPAFWQALILNAAWVILSGLGFYLYKKVHSSKEENT